MCVSNAAMCKKKQRSGEYGVADADEPDSALQHLLRSDVGSARSYKQPRSGPRVLQNQVVGRFAFARSALSRALSVSS